MTEQVAPSATPQPGTTEPPAAQPDPAAARPVPSPAERVPGDPQPSVPAGSADETGDEPAGEVAEADEPDETADEPADEPDGERPGALAAGLGVLKALAVVAAVVGLLVVAALKFGAAEALADLLRPNPVQRAGAGDCLTELPQVSGAEERTVRDVAVVDCGSAEAAYTVVGRVPEQTQEQARSGKACEQFVAPGQDGYVFYNIPPGEKGYLLCLTKKG
ncbi:hypothetical protein [Micromonospora sp. KC723]|uniref:LppU/SCO3897 family protein n=1 Tax=Micromonospora sp. KC723 TaxID=2530381 RepID=UPI0010488D44|nr:hypothetical protein [Micromonospora sp. KC723]TDB72707.1 hypothetical protein E1165_19450 [Micromonospora sp. KC723]